jgi:hypothetical protein
MSKPFDTKEVKAAADALAEAQAALATAESNYGTVKGMGGQQGYRVHVNGVAIDVAVMGGNYQGTLVRGREMIHLGALKALQGVIDAWKAEVSRRRQALRQIAAAFAEAV